MEQTITRTAAMQRAAEIKTTRTEAADTVRHSWAVLTGMNVLAILIPLLIPVAFVVCAVLMQLPLTAATVAAGVASLLVCMALQSFVTPGLASGLVQMAAGKEVRLCALKDTLDDAGRTLGLYAVAMAALCAWMLPGAAILWLGSTLMGVWQIIVMAIGGAALLVMLAVALLRYSMSLFCLVQGGLCCPFCALKQSAKLMKGRKRQLVKTIAPSMLILVGLTAAMALVLWPLAVKRDFLTDSLMVVSGVAYVIAAAYIFMLTQATLACLYHSINKE